MFFKKKRPILPFAIEKIFAKNGFVCDGQNVLHKTIGAYREITMIISWEMVDGMVFVKFESIKAVPVFVCGEDKKMHLTLEQTFEDQKEAISVFEKIQQEIASFYKKSLKDEEDEFE